MRLWGRRNKDHRTEHDTDLDVLATSIANDFMVQCVAVSGAEKLARAITRGEKSVETLISEIQWDAPDDPKQKRTKKLVEEMRAERRTNPGLLTLIVTMPRVSMKTDDYQSLGARVGKKLVSSHVQSMYVAVRDDMTVWFIGTFAR